MQIHGIDIVDTFAEAFPMSACRVIVTAASESWVQTAAHAATGYAASVIGCDAEAGIERVLPDHETPDHRPGVALLFFAFNREALQKAVVNRVGQCVLTCATTAVFSGLNGEPGKSIRVGGNLRYFGDGWQISKLLKGKRYWRMPVMDGEFLCEDQVGTVKGCAGGNFILLGRTQGETLAAAEAGSQCASWRSLSSRSWKWRTACARLPAWLISSGTDRRITGTSPMVASSATRSRHGTAAARRPRSRSGPALTVTTRTS
jgi:formylmethanofuran--tetrahydromethanopterin N-formyltransferase